MIIIRLGIRELALHARLTFVMSLAIGVPLMCFFFLNALQTGLQVRYPETLDEFLVVQVSGSFGEFFGSRLPASMSDELRQAGASLVIPEIHTIVGTTYADAILLRGIQLDNYALVNEYRMIAGRPLLPGDQPRLAMIGSRLASSRSVLPGETIQIRGRDFRVIGIFDSLTYSGNEAWISLPDAQTLLGWGTDVSIYLIPRGETYRDGDILDGGVSIVQKGDSNAALVNVWQPVFRLLGMVAIALGLAASVGLASILWRLAWLQRRSLAILRSIGFGKASLTGYLLVQSGVISILGFMVGSLGARLLGAFSQITAAGISIQAVFDSRVIVASMVFAAGITIAGSIMPAWWLNRFNLVELLRSE